MRNKKIEEKLKYYMSLNYPMLIAKDEDEGIFIVRYTDLPGCMAHGKTVAGAVKLAEVVKAEWIEFALLDNYPIPEPKKEEDYSGKFVLRITPAEHKRLSEQAAREGRSLNQHASLLLSERSNALDIAKQITKLADETARLERVASSIGAKDRPVLSFCASKPSPENFDKSRRDTVSVH